MLVKDQGARGFWLGLAILTAGILIGRLARPDLWFDPAPQAEPVIELPEFLAPGGTDEAPDNALELLRLEIPEASAATLQRVRERALERGVILQDEADTVPARIGLGDGPLYPATIRIKGDWTDHVEGRKWSLRVRLDEGRLLGMRTFSIQAPETRGMLWEWLVHEAARREGVLAPRSTFVNVLQNGHDTGVWFLEEHFSKELLESQGRREGPIVLWDESTHWQVLLHHAQVPGRGIDLNEPRAQRESHAVRSAFVRAYGEKRLDSIDSLARSLHSAVEQMRALREASVVADGRASAMRALQALEELQGRTVEQLVNVERLSVAHALASLFQVQHSLAWHNMRFYHDPVLDRLEPILFDNNAHVPSGPEPVPFRSADLTGEFVRSTQYYDGLFVQLARLVEPGWVDALFKDLGDDLARFESALDAEAKLGQAFTVAGMRQRLRGEVAFLRRLIFPPDAVNVEGFYELDETAPDRGQGWIEVLAWATSEVPAVVEGFRFSNGTFLPAADALVPGALGSHRVGAGIVLPYDGRSVAFRFPMDERLANLASIEEIKRAARAASEASASLELDVDVLTRPLASATSGAEPLRLRAREARWVTEQGRPAAPSVAEILALHPFLEFDRARNFLTAFPGRWEVSGDLVLPAGVGLALGPGTYLRFDAEAVLLASGPLIFRGGPGAPVVLEPKEGNDRWRGICVLEASERSEWDLVTVRSTDAVARAGWIVTGGITFYRSPVTMRRTRIEGTWAEDGTNLFGTDFLLEEVTFTGCASDSLDGDFVTGEVRRCVFEKGLADGVDFSGSDVRIVDCRFSELGDKACSIGEDTRAVIRGGLASDVSIGIASKDRSQVEVDGFTIRGARNYALAAFVKKPEFGPSRLMARNLSIEGSGLGDAIVQTGCVVELDGVTLATQDLDVDQLYRDRVLGQ